MAKYKSHFLSLSFYVNGEQKQFIAGSFESVDAETTKVLDNLADVVRVDEPKVVEPKAEEKPAKAKSANKPSAK